MTNNAVIYIIQDPDTFDIRYVGLSLNHPQRFKEHIHRLKSRKYFHLPLYCWMKTLKKLPIFTPIYFTTKTYIAAAEIYWIKYFRSIGCRLLNCTDGGGLYLPTPEVRQKISKAKKKLYRQNPFANPAKGKPKPNRKPFVDMFGKTWEHTRQAAVYYKVDRASIMRVLKGKQRQVGGITFQYLSVKNS